MIEARGLTKRYGDTVAVRDLSFTAASGRVTGFLGPNGAGKSTTMRMLLGLDRADAGDVSLAGKRLIDFPKPLRRVGALLDAGYVHPTRRAHDHLWALAASNGLPHRRVPHVLELVGLGDVADKAVGGFSLGMKQRLGLAAAMLGDPGILLFDEPANGLDPEGISWMRTFLQHRAAEGRTVFVSSHLLSEMAQTAEDLVVIGRGELIYEGTVEGFVDRTAHSWVTVRSPQLKRLALALRDGGARVSRPTPDTIEVVGTTAAAIGDLAAELGVAVHELSPRTASLEDVFLRATASSQEFAGEREDDA